MISIRLDFKPTTSYDTLVRTQESGHHNPFAQLEN